MNSPISTLAEPIAPGMQISVSVKLVEAGKGNCGRHLNYLVACENFIVQHRDTVINFKLHTLQMPPKLPNVLFKDITLPPDTQFSAASLSVDKTMLTLSDLCSERATFEFTLGFDAYAAEGTIEETFSLDPQVGNEPIVFP
jgi:hypothetical protein